MSASVGLQTYLIPILTVLYLFFYSRSVYVIQTINPILRVMMLMLVAAMAADVAALFARGQSGPYHRYLVLFSNGLFFAFSALMSYFWLIYAMETLYGNRWRRHLSAWFLSAIPLLLFLTFLILTPWYGLIFTLDDQGNYQRGALLWTHLALCLAYMLTASVMALRQRNREITNDLRQRDTLIALLVIPPIIGDSFQTLFYGSITGLPSAALSILILCINQQHMEISLDSMTGLNNRRRLDSFLQDFCKKPGAGKMSWFILIDIDHFKQINDHYGHLSGDKALRQTASVLKMVFGGEDAFLARYGGDEFAVVLTQASEEKVLEYIDNLNLAMELSCSNKNISWKLALSVGYTRIDLARGATLKEVIAAADLNMYKAKQAKKNNLI